MKVEQLSLADYNKIKNIPVINQDLSASGFTPVANTYYRHTGTTGTYKQGVIYYYDGTEYKALDGAGGISDVKVNGTSIVTDGVANILNASTTKSGVVTNDTQSIAGIKTFLPNKSYSNNGFVFDWHSAGVYPLLRPKSARNGLIGNISYPFNAVYALTIGASDCVKTPVISKYDKYNTIVVPDYSGTFMVAPSTWSSGTSGSVTLTESGTYQIYMNDGKNNINFGLVYFDASTDTYAQTPMINHTEGFMLSIEGSLGDHPKTLHIYQIDNVGHTQTEVNYTVYYRRVGI